MQDYRDFAEKNGVRLLDTGPCQFCGAQTKRGIHECLEIFHLSFQTNNSIDQHLYRFLIVDAHALQHPEIHGRWSNHFHLCRLHLIFKHGVKWTYAMSPKLSDYLNAYKQGNEDEYLIPPDIQQRGTITSTQILNCSSDEQMCKALIEKWAKEVYVSWQSNHQKADAIANGFLATK